MGLMNIAKRTGIIPVWFYTDTHTHTHTQRRGVLEATCRVAFPLSASQPTPSVAWGEERSLGCLEGTCKRGAGALASTVPPGVVFVKVAWGGRTATQHGHLGEGLREDRWPSAGQVQQRERAPGVRRWTSGGLQQTGTLARSGGAGRRRLGGRGGRSGRAGVGEGAARRLFHPPQQGRGGARRAGAVERGRVAGHKVLFDRAGSGHLRGFAE